MGKAIKLSAIVLLGALFLTACSSSTPAIQTAPPPATVLPPPAPTIPAGVSIGNLAPDFQLQTLSGESVSLSGLRGKSVLLNFWATWCGPCKFEMPFLQQINDTWSSKGLVVLEVDVGEKLDVVQKYMTDNNLSMTVAMDTDMKVTSKSYLIGAIPTTFLIDKDGVIRYKMVGAFPNAEAIEKELRKVVP